MLNSDQNPKSSQVLPPEADSHEHPPPVTEPSNAPPRAELDPDTKRSMDSLDVPDISKDFVRTVFGGFGRVVERVARQFGSELRPEHFVSPAAAAHVWKYVTKHCSLYHGTCEQNLSAICKWGVVGHAQDAMRRDTDFFAEMRQRVLGLAMEQDSVSGALVNPVHLSVSPPSRNARPVPPSTRPTRRQRLES